MTTRGEFHLRITIRFCLRITEQKISPNVKFNRFASRTYSSRRGSSRWGPSALLPPTPEIASGILYYASSSSQLMGARLALLEGKHKGVVVRCNSGGEGNCIPRWASRSLGTSLLPPPHLTAGRGRTWQPLLASRRRFPPDAEVKSPGATTAAICRPKGAPGESAQVGRLRAQCT